MREEREAVLRERDNVMEKLEKGKSLLGWMAMSAPKMVLLDSRMRIKHIGSSERLIQCRTRKKTVTL